MFYAILASALPCFLRHPEAVEDTTRVQLADNVTSQCNHLGVMDLEFENLEGLADYLGRQDNPVTAETATC